MPKLKFDQTGEKKFQLGVSEGVLFPYSNGIAGTGVAWNGLTSVNDTPDGGDEQAQYADNIKYISVRGPENRNGTINCFTYPEEFNKCLGLYGANGVYISGQQKTPFNLAYKTKIGNDTMGVSYGEKIHIVYNATSNSSDTEYQTMNDSPEGIELSYEFATNPVSVDLSASERSSLASKFPDLANVTQTAYIEIEKTAENASKYTEIENLIYGTDAGSDGGAGTQPTCPTPTQILQILLK